MYHDDIEYAAKRLSNTMLCLRTGMPFIISHVEKVGSRTKIRGYAYPSADANPDESEVDLDDLDLTPVPLGNVNIKDKCYFAARKPMRKDWCQGLSKNALLVQDIVNKKVISLNFSNLVPTVLGQYPKFNHLVALKAFRGHQAFSRDFSLLMDKDGTTLYYRFYKVGDVKGGIPFLTPDKLFLREHLQEATK